MKKNLLSLFILLISITSLFAQRAVPELWGTRVHDDAKVLSPEIVVRLEKALKFFEDSTTNQVGILIIPSLDGDAIESYALRVAEAWKLGTLKNDNGVLLLIVVNDRKIRIEVGQGLEGVLTDALSSRIIRNEIAPAFRRQDYNAGIVAGTQAILLAIKGEYKNTDGATGARKGRSGSSILIFIIIFIILSIVSRIKGGGKNGGSGWSSGAGWFAAGMLMGGGGNRGGGGGFGGFSGGGGSFGGGGSSGSW